MRNRRKSQKNSVGIPSKLLIFQLLMALKYQTWYQIDAKIQPIYLIVDVIGIPAVYLYVIKQVTLISEHTRMYNIIKVSDPTYMLLIWACARLINNFVYFGQILVKLPSPFE